MELKVWSNPVYTNNDFTPISVNFQPGITMLIGSNGVGKSTLLKQIDSIFNKGSWETIEFNDEVRNEYACYLYSNEYEEKYTKQSWLEGDNTLHQLASTFANSEGQDMWDYLYYKLPDIGNAVRVSKEKELKGIFILLDGLDSGLSLDKLYKLKTDLLDFIIEEETTPDFKVYLICSANSYEFIEGYNCVEVTDKQRNLTFKNYEEFKSYFLKEKEIK